MTNVLKTITGNQNHGFWEIKINAFLGHNGPLKRHM
jgi:hypothetical protein